MRRSLTANGSADNNLADTIKFVSNEPSLGLYYLQQHIRKSTPHLINLKRKLRKKSHENALQGEDLEDSITMTKSMKECGVEVVDAMIREIEKSLSTLSKRQLERGSLSKSSSGSLGRTKSESRIGEKTNNGYLSSVLKSMKQRGGRSLYSFGAEETRQEEAARIETEKSLIDPSLMMNERAESVSDLLLLCDGYDEFKACKEAKLEEWLQSVGNESALQET